MKTLIKHATSTIIANSLKYPDDRGVILEELDKEQDFYCAYTEESFTPGYARDIEHFDPTLKKTTYDGYNNWFSASTRFNRRKGSKKRWQKHQPIMYPTDSTLENRLVYKNGYYIVSNINDMEANNLREFLFLNKMGLPKARIAYINNLRFLLKNLGNNIFILEAFLKGDKASVRYRTALKAEFGINI